MDFEMMKEWFSQENIEALLRDYSSFGPLPGIILPMLEAFIPVLPLVVFVVANAAAFGLWLGFLYSWFGAIAGSLLVFFLVRKYGQRRFFSFVSKHKKVKGLMSWVERHGFGPIFLLLCFPFTPSAVINVVAGLSKVSTPQFILAVICGKLVMIFTISFIGYDIKALFHKPVKTIIVLGVLVILWFIGKRVEAWLKVKPNLAKDR
ncbi:TVP38/TMEM64 family protein [Fredinandcohnia quinoae]|uniref:TVP38/TMEM64 family membrane protein n=1 Tax=Fredinandcohnia quinoae TaxID=2918902 RepID=A0AAW5EAF4_9BACI|nr:TVP38/TMEM64 family protein [Fredinandcohnia sp. SECRCQ15]MCH1626857.1 TVP38/TMEM64 family protein [Fredinandcohnia sp. SECRCQ15]